MKTMNNFIMSAVAGLILITTEAKADLLQCKPCPRGYICNGKNKYPCPEGSVPNSSTAASYCVPCHVNEYYVATEDIKLDRCKPCPPGTISGGAASSCITCKAGQYVRAEDLYTIKGRKWCEDCADGYFQLAENQDYCSSCDALYVYYNRGFTNEEFYGINDTYFNGKKVTFNKLKNKDIKKLRDSVKGFIYSDEAKEIIEYHYDVFSAYNSHYVILDENSKNNVTISSLRQKLNTLINMHRYEYICLIDHLEGEYFKSGFNYVITAQSDDGELLCLKDYTVSCNKSTGAAEITGTDPKGQKSTISIATKYIR